MDLLIFKMFIKSGFNMNIKTIFFNFSNKVIRKNNSGVIINNRFYHKLYKGSKIITNNGFLTINKIFSSPDKGFTTLKMLENSKINVLNHFDIFSGAHIILMPNAILNLGSGYINYDVKIRCFKEITIGENVAISENVTIWDSDVHSLEDENHITTSPIKIGNNVWIGKHRQCCQETTQRSPVVSDRNQDAWRSGKVARFVTRSDIFPLEQHLLNIHP